MAPVNFPSSQNEKLLSLNRYVHRGDGRCNIHEYLDTNLSRKVPSFSGLSNSSERHVD